MPVSKQHGYSLFVLLTMLCTVYTPLTTVIWKLTGTESGANHRFITETAVHYICDNAGALFRDHLRQWTSGANAPAVDLGSMGTTFTPPSTPYSLTDLLQSRNWLWPPSIATPYLYPDPNNPRDEKDLFKDIELETEFGAVQFTTVMNDISKADLRWKLTASCNENQPSFFKKFKFYTFQHVEIIKRPLTSFHVFSDGDLSIFNPRQDIDLRVDGPIYINGNLFVGNSASNPLALGNTFVGGHLFRVPYGSSINTEYKNYTNRCDLLHKGDTGRNFLAPQSIYYHSEIPKNISNFTSFNQDVSFGEKFWKAGSSYQTSDLYKWPLTSSPFYPSFEALALDNLPSLQTRQPWLRLPGFDPTQYNFEGIGSPDNFKKNLVTYWGGYELLTPLKNWNDGYYSSSNSRKDYTVTSGTAPNLTKEQMKAKFELIRNQKIHRPASTPTTVTVSATLTSTDNLKTLEKENQSSGSSPYKSNFYNQIVEKRPYVLDTEDLANKTFLTTRKAIWGYFLRAKHLTTHSLFSLSSTPAGFSIQVGSATPDLNIDSSNNITRSSTEIQLASNSPYILFDKNRRKWVQLIEIDVGNLAPDKTLYYVGEGNNGAMLNVNQLTKDIRINYASSRLSGTSRDTNYLFTGIGVRLKNAETLKTNLTLITPFPVYIQGNFNTATPKNATIVADNVTVLSNQWEDLTSRLYSDHPLKKAVTSPVTINAHLIVGTPHPDYMYKGNNNKIPECGLLGVVKILENWGTHSITLGGAVVVPFRSKAAWEPWGTTNSYGTGATTDPTRSIPKLNFSPCSIFRHDRQWGFTTNSPFCPCLYEIKAGKTDYYTITNNKLTIISPNIDP
jgi:hypothetical protein